MRSTPSQAVVRPWVRDVMHLAPVVVFAGCATAAFLKPPTWPQAFAVFPSAGVAALAIVRGGRRVGEASASKLKAGKTGLDLTHVDRGANVPPKLTG